MIYVVLAAFLYGLAGALTHNVSTSSASTSSVYLSASLGYAAFNLLEAIVLWAWCSHRGESVQLDVGAKTVLAAAISSVAYVITIVAYRKTSAFAVVMSSSASDVFTLVLIAIALSRSPSKRELLGVLFVLSGVYLLKRLGNMVRVAGIEPAYLLLPRQASYPKTSP